MEVDQELKDLNAIAINKYGKHQRINKTIEELIELAHILTKINKLPVSELNANSEMFQDHYFEFFGEVADVFIMLENLLYTVNASMESVNYHYAEKVLKFKRHVELTSGSI